MKSKVELLAPAGSPDAFYGAISAGADAVYLAGNRFGARAYADNFTEEQLIDAIQYAHLFRVKVYMTVNTLFKNKEMQQLADFLEPYYLAGLDGVIVQDFGVLSYIKKHFPGLELHVSTQMTITSAEGASFLKDLGVQRVVPARELSLEELKTICAQGIEVESFIHGSMCYCYSGQCLFSSIIGGRSGNRGRCAQPCRLPYRYENGQETYFFSLKDMCTLQLLPKILESGITSLKIEGRMKNPAYAAGVTAIYRKYIERYEKDPALYCVDKDDLEKIKHLYIRSELQEGYYTKQHGKDMITLKSPAYSKTDDALMNDIIQKYVQTPKRIMTNAFVRLHVGEPVLVRIDTILGEEKLSVSYEGEIVQEARNAPLTKEDVIKRFSKTGDSVFEIHISDADLGANVFLPVKTMNEARREALKLLEQAFCEKQKESFRLRRPLKHKEETDYLPNEKASAKGSFYDKLKVFVLNEKQLKTVTANQNIQNVVLPLSLAKQEAVLSFLAECKCNIYLTLPAVCREAMWDSISKNIGLVNDKVNIKGYYVNQFDSLSYMKKNGISGEICGDIHLYCMNAYAATEISSYTDSYTLSVELNAEEMKHMPMAFAEIMIYGRYPLMNTANCVFLTHGKCQKKNGEAFTLIKDRKGSMLPVIGNCTESICYNTVYNSVPTSLHRNASVISSLEPHALQIRFVDENPKQINEVLSLFDASFAKNHCPSESFAYTNGHYKRRVE